MGQPLSLVVVFHITWINPLITARAHVTLCNHDYNPDHLDYYYMYIYWYQ